MPMCVAPEDKDYMILMNWEDSLKEEFRIFRSIPLQVYPVSQNVTNSHIDSDFPEIVNEVTYTELADTAL